MALLPSDPLLRARANEWMSLLSSTVHVAFITEGFGHLYQLSA